MLICFSFRLLSPRTNHLCREWDIQLARISINCCDNTHWKQPLNFDFVSFSINNRHLICRQLRLKFTDGHPHRNCLCGRTVLPCQIVVVISSNVVVVTRKLVENLLFNLLVDVLIRLDIHMAQLFATNTSGWQLLTFGCRLSSTFISRVISQWSSCCWRTCQCRRRHSNIFCTTTWSKRYFNMNSWRYERSHWASYHCCRRWSFHTLLDFRNWSKGNWHTNKGFCRNFLCRRVITRFVIKR